MKRIAFILLTTVAVFTVIPAIAQNNKQTTTSTTSKSHNFEDLLVNGKYHFSDEAISTVEADKVFDSLIGLRTDFKDRLEASAQSK